MTVEEAIERALAEVGLGEAQRDEIRRMLDDPAAAQRACCGGLCDPCVTSLRRALERTRALLRA